MKTVQGPVGQGEATTFNKKTAKKLFRVLCGFLRLGTTIGSFQLNSANYTLFPTKQQENSYLIEIFTFLSRRPDASVRNACLYGAFRRKQSLGVQGWTL